MGQSPKIDKSSLNGTDRFTLTSSVGKPLGITLDRRNRRVFWVDSGFGMATVKSFDYDGNNRTILFQKSQSFFLFSAVTLFSSHLFLIEENNNSICKVNSSSGVITACMLVGGVSAPMGLVPYDSSRQQTG